MFISFNNYNHNYYLMYVLLLLSVAIYGCKDESRNERTKYIYEYDLNFPLEKVVIDNKLSSINGFTQISMDTINERLFICDTEGNRLLLYDLEGNYLETWGENKLSEDTIGNPLSVAFGYDRIAIGGDAFHIIFTDFQGNVIKQLIYNDIKENIVNVSLVWYDRYNNLWIGVNTIGRDRYLRFRFLKYVDYKNKLAEIDLTLINPIGKLNPGITTTNHFLSPVYVAIGKRGVFIKDSYDYKIYFIDYISMNVETIIDRKAKRIKVLEHEYSELKNKAKKKGYNLAYFDEYPALKKIFIDEEEYIWVTSYKDYIESKSNNEYKVYVYDQSGTLIGSGMTNLVSTRNTSPLFYNDKIYSLAEDGVGGIKLNIFQNNLPLHYRIKNIQIPNYN